VNRADSDCRITRLEMAFSVGISTALDGPVRPLGMRCLVTEFHGFSRAFWRRPVLSASAERERFRSSFRSMFESNPALEELEFPGPGGVLSRQFESVSRGPLAFLAQFFTPTGAYVAVSKATGVFIGPVGPQDSLGLIAVGPRLITGVAWHADPSNAKQCVVRCADGSSSQTCVTCRHKDVTVKICC
jgi:hypothetical protein